MENTFNNYISELSTGVIVLDKFICIKYLNSSALSMLDTSLKASKKKKLNELDFNEVTKIKNGLDKNVMKVFNVRNSVNLKSSYGGTSTKNIKKMISKLKKEFK